MNIEPKTLQCACGAAEMEAVGPHILCLACYCEDCQEAAKRLESLPDVKPLRGPDGGTPLVLQRKDRFRISRGAEKLEAHKLRESSSTSRYVASCCNTPMYLGFDNNLHWVSIFRDRYGDEAPAVQFRCSTKAVPEFEAPKGGIPSYATFPPALVLKLMGARLAMLLRR